jgi:threonine dehydrogenase-like Zn-dependent dehydrogenase
VGKILASVAVKSQTSRIQEFALPDVPADGGLLKVEAAGVCGSDVRSYKRDRPPLILGHENVGVIAAIGRVAAARWGVAEGDRVVLEEYLPCGHCETCRTTDFRLCPQTDSAVPGSLRYGSVPLDREPALWGGYSQYLYLHPNSVLHPAPTDVPAAELALSLPLANGYEWACVEGGAGPGKTVVVIGPGQQGLGCVFAAAQAGAEHVIALGLAGDGDRLASARALGADTTIILDGTSDPVTAISSLSGSRMADVVIDTASGGADSVRLAIDLLRPRGRLLLSAAPPAVDGIPLKALQWKVLNVRGVRGHSYGAVTWAIGKIRENAATLEAIRSRTFPLSEVDTAIRATGGETDNIVHAVVDPWL